MIGYCSVCRVSPRSMSAHLGTLRHRQATRPPVSGRRHLRCLARPSWMLAQARHEEDYASPEALARAEAWLREG